MGIIHLSQTYQQQQYGFAVRPVTVTSYVGEASIQVPYLIP